MASKMKCVIRENNMREISEIMAKISNINENNNERKYNENLKCNKIMKIINNKEIASAIIMAKIINENKMK